MSPDTTNRIVGISAGGIGIVAAVIGYFTTTENTWGTIIIGFFLGSCLGINLLALIKPGALVQMVKERGEDQNLARGMPIMTSIIAAVLYFIFRDVLANQSIWQPIIIGGVVVGLLGTGRLLTATPEKP